MVLPAFPQLSDVVENEEKMAYLRPSGGGGHASSGDEPRGPPSKGFVVREAPWTTGSEKVGGHNDGSLASANITTG